MPDARNGGRPSPEAWIDALGCPQGGARALQGGAVALPSCSAPRQCPWCAIEQPTRTKLFGGIVKTATAAIADLETLWARYLALAEPGPPRPLPKPSEWVRPLAAPRPWARWRRSMLVVATALLALFVGRHVVAHRSHEIMGRDRTTARQ